MTRQVASARFPKPRKCTCCEKIGARGLAGASGTDDLGRQHQTAVMNEIVEPLRQRDQRQGLGPGLLVIAGFRQMRAKHDVDVVLDLAQLGLILEIPDAFA
jgi:hypothetical protein